ncbi:MAG: hypothetical protein IKS32_11155 [Solobacterium sp.]|nr:hypothetical protein [Solobacterium sp.]
MRRTELIACTALACILTGCGNRNPELQPTPSPSAVTELNISNPVEINVLQETADMSGYQWLNDDDPAFYGISLQESIRFFREGGTGIIVYSADTCPFCNRAIPLLNETLKEFGLKGYYVDTNMMIASDQATSMKLYNELCSYISQIFEKDEDGEPVFQIPEVIAVKNGEITGHHLSLLKSFTMTDKDAQLSDAQKEEMREIYRGLIRSLAD